MSYKNILLFVFILSFFSTVGQTLSDTINVTKYSIYIDEINTTAETIKGHTALRVTTNVENTSEIPLELISLEVDSVFCNDIKVMDFSYYNGRITTPLSQAINVGDTISMQIFYHGTPFSESWGGFHFSADNAFNLGVGFQSIPHNLGKTWFPCVDDFIDRAKYEFYITVDNPKKAICGGILLDEIDNNNGTSTFHWEIEQEIPTYLASVAIGEYVLYEDEYEGVERNIPIQIWCRAFEYDNIAGSFIHLKDILSYYESHWGPYPFSRVGYVSTAKGAMEHVGNIAYPYGCINGNTDDEWLYAHELSHMWFGNKVTCSTAGDMWLNEGWAVFNETLYREGLYGTESYMEEYNKTHQDVLYTAHTSSGDGDYYALYDLPQSITYGRTAYDKGSLVVHTLRYYLGDEVFFPAIREYLNAFAYQPASSYDLRDFLTNETGIDMTNFFDNWVFTTGFPGFEIDSVIATSNENEYQVFVQQKLRGRETYSDGNIIEITFMDQNWETYTETMTISGKQGSKIMNVPFTPISTYIDFYDKVSDATTDIKTVIKENGEINLSRAFVKINTTAISDSALVRITHNWIAPDSVKEENSTLRLSDYRYWKIDGIFPDDFSFSTSFFHKNSGLDNTLVINEGEELVMVYRANESYEWQVIPSTMIGQNTIGYLVIDNTQKGEYSLAVRPISGTNINNTSTSRTLNIYPNPTNKNLTIETSNITNGTINIYNATGSLVNNFTVSSNKITVGDNLPAGVYFIEMISDKKIVDKQKVVITK